VQLLDEAESHEQQPATDKKVLKAYQLSNGRFWHEAAIRGSVALSGLLGVPMQHACNTWPLTSQSVLADRERFLALGREGDQVRPDFIRECVGGLNLLDAKVQCVDRLPI
jgi:hypothetical protein